MDNPTTLFTLRVLGALVLLAAVFVIFRVVRGPLPPAPPKSGGGSTEEPSSAPRAEE